MAGIREKVNYESYYESDVKFAVPNEIFTELREDFSFSKSSYAYAYYYLQMYLYTYAKYGTENNSDKFSQKSIKEILGIKRDSSQNNDITKKGAWLDSHGYTETTKDYPVALDYMGMDGNEFVIRHYMYSEEKIESPNLARHGSRFYVKLPKKMYYRTAWDEHNGNQNGTMFDAENTHMIKLTTFFDIMDKLDYKAFYLYGYFVRYSYLGNGKFSKDLDSIMKEIGVSKKKLISTIKELEENDFLIVKRRSHKKNKNMVNSYRPL